MINDYLNRIFSKIRFLFFLKKNNGVIVPRFHIKNIGDLRSSGTSHIGYINNGTTALFPNRTVYFNNKNKVILGDKVRLHKGLSLDNEGVINIGDGTYINPNSLIICKNKITIGKGCSISWNCQILDSDLKNYYSKPKEIIIGNNVWIGLNSVILKGVSIGDNSIIAAGSIVTKSFGSNLVIGGNPARILKRDIEKWKK